MGGGIFLQEQSKPDVHKLMSLVKSTLYQILTTLFEQMDPNSPPSKLQHRQSVLKTELGNQIGIVCSVNKASLKKIIVQKILVSSFELIRSIAGASSQCYAPSGYTYYFL